MKHIKTFESLLNLPDIGDYICSYQNEYEFGDAYVDIISFMNNNYPKIRNYQFNSKHELTGYVVEYDYIPEEIHKYFGNNNSKIIGIKYVMCFGKTKKEVELKRQLNKYNL